MRGSCCLAGGWATTSGNQGQGEGREGFHKEEEGRGMLEKNHKFGGHLEIENPKVVEKITTFDQDFENY